MSEGGWREGARRQRDAFQDECSTFGARLFRDAGNGRTWRKKLRWLGRQLWQDRPEGLYLEIGTGEGDLYRSTELWPRRQVAVDPAERALVRARERRPPALPPAGWVAAFAEELPFRAGSFDGVFGIDTIHHWTDPARGFAEIARVLKPGGRMAFVEPNRRYPANLLLLASRVERGIFSLGRANLRRWAAAAGLEALQVGAVPVFFPSFPLALERVYETAEEALGRLAPLGAWSTSRSILARRPAA